MTSSRRAHKILKDLLSRGQNILQLCPRERPSLCFSKVSPSCVRWLYTFVMAGGEKSIRKALLLVGFLSYLDSRTNQAQAVLSEKSGPPFTSRHGELLVGHRQVTD